MKTFTSIHNRVSWHSYQFRCVHELEETHLLEILDALSKGSEKRKATLEFVQELRRESGGWPFYGEQDKRTQWYRILAQAESKVLSSREIRHLAGAIKSWNGDIKKAGVKPVWGAKEFPCPHYLEVSDVEAVLADWKSQRATSDDVLYFAEQLILVGGGLPTYPEDDPRATVYSIIDLLDGMYGNPILTDDIPIFLRVLAKSRIDPTQAKKTLDSYLEDVDWDARIHE